MGSLHFYFCGFYYGLWNSSCSQQIGDDNIWLKDSWFSSFASLRFAVDIGKVLFFVLCFFPFLLFSYKCQDSFGSSPDPNYQA